jgi:hypothetical protein
MAPGAHTRKDRRDRAIAAGGIGAMQLLAQRPSLAKAIDERLHLLKVPLERRWRAVRVRLRRDAESRDEG